MHNGLRQRETWARALASVDDTIDIRYDAASLILHFCLLLCRKQGQPEVNYPPV